MTSILSHRGVKFDPKDQIITLSEALNPQELYRIAQEAFRKPELLTVPLPIEPWESEDKSTIYFCCDWLVQGSVERVTIDGITLVLISPILKGP